MNYHSKPNTKLPTSHDQWVDFGALVLQSAECDCQVCHDYLNKLDQDVYNFALSMYKLATDHPAEFCQAYFNNWDPAQMLRLFESHGWCTLEKIEET